MIRTVAQVTTEIKLTTRDIACEVKALGALDLVYLLRLTMLQLSDDQLLDIRDLTPVGFGEYAEDLRAFSARVDAIRLRT